MLKIIRVVFLTSISTVIKIVSGLIINKFIAIYVGPSGLGIIGQFQNLSGIIQIIANAGITNGVIKYTAEDGNKTTLWSTAVKISIFFSSLCGLLLIIFSVPLSSYFLSESRFFYIFIIFGFTIIFFSLNQLLLAIIAGLQKINTYNYINIIQSLYAVLSTSLLIFYLKLDGALIAIVTNQSVVFLLILWYLKNSDLKIKYFLGKFDKKNAKKLYNYSIMSLVAVISLPVSSLTIRSYISNSLSWDYAGYWQALTYISSMNLLIITTVLTIYYLPRLSNAQDKPTMLKELSQNSLVLLPLTFIVSVIIFFSKDFIIRILFSEDFKAIIPLFKYQLIGDFIRICSCMLSYFMLAKSMTKTFIVTEIFSATSLTVLSIIYLNIYGFIGLSYAYFISSLIYFILMIIMIFFYFRSFRKPEC